MGGNGKPPQWEWELPALPWEFIPKGFMLRWAIQETAAIDDFSDLCDPEDMGRQRNELSDYVSIKVSKDAEMIDFWRENHAVLPQLYKVACRVLCVPASSAASERVFSTAGRRSPAGKATNQSESRVDQRVAVSSQQHEVKLWHRLDWLTVGLVFFLSMNALHS